MGNLIVIMVMIGLLVVYMMMFWYWIRTSLIMVQQSLLLGALGLLFSPIAQVIYYFSNKQKLPAEDNRTFCRYWLSIGLTVLISLVGAFIFVTTPDMIH